MFIDGIIAYIIVNIYRWFMYKFFLPSNFINLL